MMKDWDGQSQLEPSYSHPLTKAVSLRLASINGSDACLKDAMMMNGAT